MRHSLTKEQIKAIADRAEGKEPEFVLRTFICQSCQHEIVVKPETPRYGTPTLCTPCWEKQVLEPLERKQAMQAMAAASKFNAAEALDLLKEINKLLEKTKEK